VEAVSATNKADDAAFSGAASVVEGGGQDARHVQRQDGSQDSVAGSHQASVYDPLTGKDAKSGAKRVMHGGQNGFFW
jgi:hypothetical protein